MKVRVFDFFSGCGGTSAGLRAAGMQIVAGVDFDRDAEKSFRRNFPEAEFFRSDIRNLSPRVLHPLVEACDDDDLLLFCGCAPCQPFSKQNGGKNPDGGRGDLLLEFGRFVKAFRPHFVFCENVPGIQSVQGRAGPLILFKRLLDKLGYDYQDDVIESQNYGVPQHRRRLVLIASRVGPITMPKPTHGPGAAMPYATVWDAIKNLPPIKAGETDLNDPIHRASMLSDKNLRRIMATPAEGTRRSWPRHLMLECHKGRHEGHTDVYGRLRKDQPATAMTTRCISLSNGRFGHPDQHRAISVREAACLQTFPKDFMFEGSLNSMARQVGNAVPVLLARRFGEQFIEVARQTRRSTWRP